MPTRHLQGNLLASGADVIFHGCNCFHTMGAGIARQIKYTLPYAYEADLKTPRAALKTKPGTMSLGYPEDHSYLPVVANLYTQFYPGPNFKLEYLVSSLEHLKKYLDGVDPECKLVVAGPRIGCGIGGGDWDLVEQAINSVFTKRTIDIYTYEPTD